MPNDPDFVDHVLDLLDPLDGVSSRRMFGGHGIFRAGRMFALIADSTLYFKVDDVNRPEFEERGLEAFGYDSKDGKRISMSYHRAPEAALDNSDEMLSWAEGACAAAQRSASK